MKNQYSLLKYTLTLLLILLLNFICFHVKAYPPPDIHKNVRKFAFSKIVHKNEYNQILSINDTVVFVIIYDDEKLYIKDDKRTLVVNDLDSKIIFKGDYLYEVYYRTQEDFSFTIQYDIAKDKMLYFRIKIYDDEYFFKE